MLSSKGYCVVLFRTDLLLFNNHEKPDVQWKSCLPFSFKHKTSTRHIKTKIDLFGQ